MYKVQMICFLEWKEIARVVRVKENSRGIEIRLTTTPPSIEERSLGVIKTHVIFL